MKYLIGFLLLAASLSLAVSGCGLFSDSEPAAPESSLAEVVPQDTSDEISVPAAPSESVPASLDAEANADEEYARSIEAKERELAAAQSEMTPISQPDPNDGRLLQLYDPETVPEADSSYDPNLTDNDPYLYAEPEPPPPPMTTDEYLQALESAMVAPSEPQSFDQDYSMAEPDLMPVASENTQEDVLQQIYLSLIDMRDRGLPPVRNPLVEQLLPNVYFAFDQSRIEADYQELLQERIPGVLDALQLRGDMILQIEGHADERGSDEYNLALGHRRANAVYEAIRVYSADTTLIRTISFGEEFPAVPESNEQAWAKNRRVAFTFLLRD